MSELIAQASAGNPEALQAFAAVVSIVAIIPVSIVFIISQLYAISNARQAAHQKVMDLYRQFLLIDMQYPKLELSYTDIGIRKQLTKEDKIRLNSSFEFLTSIIEAAFLTYSRSLVSDRRRQWRGWEQYIREYALRPDYRRWWTEFCLNSDDEWHKIDLKALIRENYSQYDVRFEAYMIKLLATTAPENENQATGTDDA